MVMIMVKVSFRVCPACSFIFRFVARMHKLGGELMQFGEAKFTKLYGITGYNSSDTLPGTVVALDGDFVFSFLSGAQLNMTVVVSVPIQRAE